MESNQASQNQPQGSKPSTITVISILLGIAVVLFVVNGVVRKNAPVDKGNGNVVAGNVNSVTNENMNVPTNSNQARIENSFVSPLTIKIGNKNILLKFQEGCTLTKDQSEYRAGAFVSYNGSCVLSEDGLVSFGGISMYSVDSISKFQNYIDNGGFWEGGWTSPNDYQNQMIALKSAATTGGYTLENFGNRNYLVRTVINKAGGDISRGYVTFVDDIKVSLYISWGAMAVSDESGFTDQRKIDEYSMIADELFGQKIQFSVSQ